MHVNTISDLNKVCGDGSVKCIYYYKCKSKRMSNEKYFFWSRQFCITYKRIFDCVTPSDTFCLDCHSNVINNITCSRCSLQYVGETGQRIKERFNWHKTCFKNHYKYGFYWILSNHFHKRACKNASYTVHSIEKPDGTGRTARGALDASITSKRLTQLSTR